MGEAPLPAYPIYSRAEVLCSQYVARVLWILSAVLLMALGTWAAESQ